MDIVLWIMQWLLCAVFATVGLLKLVRPAKRLVEHPAMGWVADFTPLQVRLIGLAEVAGAVGLVVPALLDIWPWLTPIATAGLALDMLGAFSTHLRRDDPRPMRYPPIVLGALAIAVAVGRYWIEPF